MRAVPILLLLVAGCRQASDTQTFPKPHRDVAPIVSNSFSTEDARDRVGEAEKVMELAGVGPGMSVADVGAGEGYYAVRLAPLVGPRGRVLAEDIVPEVRDRLAGRVQHDNLDNVAVRLGTPEDPRLPPDSFDRIFMVHMYHEVESPFALLWNLRPALKPGGELIVVDADRPTRRHGTPPDLLRCELAAVGFRQVAHEAIPGTDSYYAAFRAVGERPQPSAIEPCTPGEPKSG